MRADKADAAYLIDMLHAAEMVVSFTAQHTFADYAADALLRSAIERQIEIVGEAARHISDQFKDGQPQIPWRKIMAQRHVLAHEYDDIQHDLIWKVATIYIPQLVPALRALCPAEDQGPQ